MTSPTREFGTPDVLTTITGIVVTERGIEGVYEVLNWMTGESVFTHQIPRICREARASLIALYPEFASAVTERDQVNHENWREWRDKWVDRYGPVIAVPKFTADQHERIDPLSEIAETKRPDQIIVVQK